MAGFSPVPLPSLSTLFDPAGAIGSSGAPFALPSMSLVLGTTGGRSPLSASAGSFALTGTAASLKSGRKIISAAGAFSLTGVDSTGTKGTPNFGVSDPAYLPSMSLVLERGTGAPLLSAGPGAFALAGVQAALISGRGIAANAGSFLWSGAPALRDIVVTADKGTYSYAPNAATLTKASPGITAIAGNYVLTASSAALVYQPIGVKVLPAFFGSFALTGNDAALPSTIARVLLADRGTFAMTGNSASFILVGWGPLTPATGTWTDVTPATSSWNNA